MLYGSPDHPVGDAVIERLHQQELVRRNGGGLPPARRKRSGNALPFERGTAVLAVLLCLLMSLLP